MAGDPPPNLLDAAQIRALLAKVPERVRDPEPGNQDYRPVLMTRGRWDIRDSIWTSEERDAMEATYKHFTGQDIDLTEIHRSEYERIESAMQTGIGRLDTGGGDLTVGTGSVDADGRTVRNFDADKGVVDRVIAQLSNARAHRVGFPLDDVANIRALYVAYGMEEQIYGLTTTNLSGEQTGGAANAPEGNYTQAELNNLGELRRQILHAKHRGFVTAVRADARDEAREIVETRETADRRVEEGVEDETLTGDDLTEYNRRYTTPIEVTELDPIQPPPERMAIILGGNVSSVFTEEVAKLQEAMLMAGYDVGTYPEGHEKAGQAMIDGIEDADFRAVLGIIQRDLKELDIDLDPRTTPISQYTETLENADTLLRLNVLREINNESVPNPITATHVDYRDRAEQLALTEGLTTRTAFDDARIEGTGEIITADLTLDDTPTLS